MASFKDLETGRILSTENDLAIGLMEGNTDKYEKIVEKKSAKGKAAEKEAEYGGFRHGVHGL